MTTVKLRDEGEASKVTVALPNPGGSVGRITDPALNQSRHVVSSSLPPDLPPLPERPSRSDRDDSHHSDHREKRSSSHDHHRTNARDEHRELQRVQEDELEIDPTLDFISNPAKTRQRMKDSDNVTFERHHSRRHHDEDDLQDDLQDEELMREFGGIRMEDLDLSGEGGNDEPLFPPPQQPAPQPKPATSTPPQAAASSAPKPIDPKEEAKKMKAEVDKMLADLAVWAKNPEYSGYIKNLTHKSNVEDIRACHAKVKAIRSQDAGLKISRKLLLGFTGLVEWLNAAYDPCGLLLNDWSKDVESNITDFDDVLIRIWERYGKFLHEANPLIELMLALTLSAGAYHMTQKFIKQQEEIAQQYEAQAAAQAQANARSHTNDRRQTRETREPKESDEDDEPLPDDQEYVESELRRKPKKSNYRRRTKRTQRRPPSPPIQTNVRPQPVPQQNGPPSVPAGLGGMGGLMSMMGGMLGGSSSGGMPAMFAAMTPRPPQGGSTGFADLDALLNDDSPETPNLPPGSPARVEEIPLDSENTDVTIPIPSPTGRRGRPKKTLAVD